MKRMMMTAMTTKGKNDNNDDNNDDNDHNNDIEDNSNTVDGMIMMTKAQTPGRSRKKWVSTMMT